MSAKRTPLTANRPFHVVFSLLDRSKSFWTALVNKSLNRPIVLQCAYLGTSPKTVYCSVRRCSCTAQQRQPTMSCSQTLAQQNTAMKAALVTLQKKLKGLDTQTSELSQEKESLRSKVREESSISRVGEIDGAEHTLCVPSGENSWRSCFEASSTGARKTSPACQLPGTSTGADNPYTVGLTHKKCH